LHISPIFCTFVPAEEHHNFSMEQSNHNAKNSQFKAQSLGRTELATRYFPHILPQTAWQKLRGLLASDPDLAPLAQLKRRSFLPVEVNKIYQALGQP
jgi:hypothetical protein